jgi:polyisoprenyl-phosphate glycosyltransferase
MFIHVAGKRRDEVEAQYFRLNQIVSPERYSALVCAKVPVGMPSPVRPVYSFVLPIFNEEAVMPVLLHRLDRLMEQLDGPAEVIFVDDGSTDTCSIVAAYRAKEDPRYRYLSFSRNFGQQMAITAGFDRAQGDCVIVMDADLQDPPEVALQMIEKWKEGFEIVYARRLSREGESRLKLLTSFIFYKTLTHLTAVKIPEKVSDFRLVDRKVVDAFKAMPERDRYVRGMFSWLGFRQTAVDFHREARAAGNTKYSYRKLARLAMDSVIGFSDVPLRLALWLGALTSLGAVGYGIFVIALAFVSPNAVPGWSSLAVLTSFFAGVNLLTTGIVGLYVGRIHNEAKQRPLYVVREEIGFDRVATSAARPVLYKRRRGERSVA